MDISKLTNEEVWRRFISLAAEERVVVADLVSCLAEVDRRTLVRERDWPTLFEYCVYSLHWSESAAYRRIRAARAVRRFPIILEMLRDGRLHLEGVVILHAFIEDADFASLLLKAVGLTTRKIEHLVADRRRDPPVRDSMRFVGVRLPSVASEPAPALELPSSGTPENQSRAEDPSPFAVALARPAAAASPPSPAADLPRLVRIGFTADETLSRMVLHAQLLMRHKYPDGRLEGIFHDALKLLIEKTDLGVRAAAAAARRAGRNKRGASPAIPP